MSAKGFSGLLSLAQDLMHGKVARLGTYFQNATTYYERFVNEYYVRWTAREWVDFVPKTTPALMLARAKLR